MTPQAKNRRYAQLQKLIDADEFFAEEAIMQREPLLYHMYVGRYSNRNSSVRENMNPKDLSKFLFQRIDKQEYEASLQAAYERHLLQHGECYFTGALDEAMETD